MLLCHTWALYFVISKNKAAPQIPIYNLYFHDKETLDPTRLFYPIVFDKIWFFNWTQCTKQLLISLTISEKTRKIRPLTSSPLLNNYETFWHLFVSKLLPNRIGKCSVARSGDLSPSPWFLETNRALLIEFHRHLQIFREIHWVEFF